MKCNQLKSELGKVRKAKHCMTHNSLLRNEYHKELKDYKTKCKTKRYVFWQCKSQKNHLRIVNYLGIIGKMQCNLTFRLQVLILVVNNGLTIFLRCTMKKGMGKYPKQIIGVRKSQEWTQTKNFKPSKKVESFDSITNEMKTNTPDTYCFLEDNLFFSK